MLLCGNTKIRPEMRNSQITFRFDSFTTDISSKQGSIFGPQEIREKVIVVFFTQLGTTLSHCTALSVWQHKNGDPEINDY